MNNKNSKRGSKKLYELANEAIVHYMKILAIDEVIENEFQGNELPAEDWLKLHYVMDRFYRIAHENRPF